MSAREDTPLNRFVTFVVAVAVFGAFGAGTGLLLLAGSRNNWRQIEAPAAAARAKKLETYRASLPVPPEVDASTAVAILGDSKPVKTAAVVPGSPTSLKPVEQKHDPAESELLN